MRRLKIITEQGVFETESSWNLEILARNLNIDGFSRREKENEAINIGDFIFRKGDVIRVELVRN